MKPGTHAGVSMADYLAAPAVSASVLQLLLSECPYAAWFASHLNPNRPTDESSEAQDVGTVAHSILLDGHADNVVIVDATDWRTNAAKEKREEAREAGKIAMLAHKFPAVEAMVSAAMAYIESLKHDEPAIWAAFAQPDEGESELTMVWQDGPTLCRIRPDRITRDRKLIVDVKTTQRSAEPDSWGRYQMVGAGFYTSAAFYRRGVEALCKVSPAYAYLVIEQEPPHLCSLVGMDPHAFALGTQKIAVALEQWARCVARNHWPSYPTKICYPVMPPYEEARWEEFQLRGFEYDPAQLFGETK